MSTVITTDTTIPCNEGLVQSQIDDETVMMSIESSDYYGLDYSQSNLGAHRDAAYGSVSL